METGPRDSDLFHRLRPHTTASLLDMTVFVSEIRYSLEEHWKPRVFNESANPLLESSRLIEAALWRLTEKLLKPEQQAELREALKVWHQQESNPENVLIVRAAGLALQVSQVRQADTAKPGSLFSLLMLDPLSNLDPTRREIAQARLFAERALYVTQKVADGTPGHQRAGAARLAALVVKGHADRRVGGSPHARGRAIAAAGHGRDVLLHAGGYRNS